MLTLVVWCIKAYLGTCVFFGLGMVYTGRQQKNNVTVHGFELKMYFTIFLAGKGDGLEKP